MFFNGRNIIRCVSITQWIIFEFVCAESFLTNSNHQHCDVLFDFVFYATTQPPKICRNGKLMAKVKRWTRKKWQKLEMAKYKPTSKDWTLELPTLWDWEYWLKEVNLRPERPVLSWLSTLRRSVVHPSHRVWFCDVWTRYYCLCLCSWGVYVYVVSFWE